MSERSGSFLRRVYRDEGGQVVPFVVLLTVLFLGMAGLTIDLGNAFVCYRELQASTDAAAMAAGYELGQSSATSTLVQQAAAQYGSASTTVGGVAITGNNVNPNLAGATISTTLECSAFVTKAGIPCSASTTGDNAAIVKQSVTINTIFIRALAALPFAKNPVKTLTLTAMSTAAMRGSTNAQYNVAVVLDSTGSMGSADTDGNCAKNTTKEVCALAGIQTLLSGLTPCGPGSTSSTCSTSFDSVGIFTFPNVKASTTTDATTCSGSNPQGAPYSAPVIGATWSTPSGSAPNYEITSGFLDSYSSTNASGGSIATTSPLGILTGADTGKNCTGLQTPISGQGTYLAGAIYAAQSALVAAQTANPSSLNALVILTDGDANASNPLTNSAGVTLTSKTTPALGINGAYPSLVDQCQQAITASQYAATNNTSVYVVAYEAGTSGCSTDAKAYQDPCTNLAAMALKAGSTAPYAPYFYSDATTSNGGACTSTANPNLTLNQVFQSVSGSFTQSRLIPNGD